MSRPGGTPSLRATYRLQLGPAFGFDAAADTVGYLAALGVSHLYLSPVGEAVPGSTHGYDMVDPTRVREELGGRAAFGRLVDVARTAGVGIVLDIVPHHLGVHRTNRWWWDVLARGEASPWSGWFDIDWSPPEPGLRGRVLLPVLGDHYGRELEAGHLTLERDGGWLLVGYHEHCAPLDPISTGELLAGVAAVARDEELGFAARAMATLTGDADVTYARALAASRLERNPEAAVALDSALAAVVDDPDRLDELLSRQHHRLARWATADAELDYRRFFDIDSLVALRAERDDVFAATHRLALDLLEEGAVQGLRIDHVDGLRDPAHYLHRLRAAAGDAWLVVEKIRHLDEGLPADWPVDGTTGYETAAAITGLLLDPAGHRALVSAWSDATGRERSYPLLRLEARRELALGQLRSDVERVVAALVALRDGNRRWRDFTRVELSEAMVEVAVHMSVYRAYVVPGMDASDADRAQVSQAVEGARAARPDLDSELFDLLRDLLVGEVSGLAAVAFVARFQQLTGPLAAKGEEDTALYRYTPCLAACEVGMDPGDPCIDPDRFHRWCVQVSSTMPATMSTTSTHDTKRSEDVRARLAVLTEDPERFVTGLAAWVNAVDAVVGRSGEPGPALHPADRWFIFQTLIGAWPIDAGRVWTVVGKSLREAKVTSSWARPDVDYEASGERWCRAATTEPALREWLDAFVAPLVEPGRVNSLSTVVLRLLGPGVPDTYQGTETWDLSLVDPDNRRPVDFGALARGLDRVAASSPAALWSDPGDRDRGLPKLALVHALLRLRAERPECFGPDGGYEPLVTSAGSVLAFSRAGSVLAAVPRLSRGDAADSVTVHLPAGPWTNLCTGTMLAGGPTRFGTVRSGFPVAVLVRH